MTVQKDNGAEFRPVPFYFINTRDEARLTQPEIDRAMRRLQGQHYGGIVLFNKPPEGFTLEEYLEEPWFALTERFVRACRACDLGLWINDGFNFPPGDAGGRIERVAPHLKPKILVLRESGEVGVDELTWGFPAFEEPESSSLFLRFVYEAYRKRLGNYFGAGITGFFSDADNRRVTPFCAAALGKRPHFPWSSDFAARFRARFGYELEPHLPALLRDGGGQAAEDYWRLAGELYQQWFRNNYEWCHRHGLRYSFHTSDTGPFSRLECPRSSIFTEGDALEFLTSSDCPGTDHELLRLDGGTHFDGRFYSPIAPWGAVPESKPAGFADTSRDLRAKYAASAAWLHGKDRVLCEAFAATNWGVTFQELRRIATWQIMQGVNFFVPHAVHHRLGGGSKYFAPPEFSLSSLAYGVREFNDFLADWSQQASAGELVAPVAVIDPTPEIWRGEADGDAVARVCDRLNRQGWGYRIVPRKRAQEFEFVFDPARGTAPELPDPPVAFTGDGELHFMLRQLADGSRFVLAANVWSDAPVTGVIRFEGRAVELTLAPGEIARIGDGGDSWQPLLNPERLIGPDAVEVTRLDRHRIPLRDLREWVQAEPLTGLELLAPEAWAGKVRCNGELLETGRGMMIYDDAYVAYPLPAGAGRRRIDFDGAEPPPELPVFLEGDVTAQVSDAPETGPAYLETYNLTMPTARGARLELRAPAEALTAGDLGKQGYPFYSGRVRYRLHYRQQGRLLYFPAAGHITEVWCGGKPLATVIFDGARVELPSDWDGWIELIQHNTLGNQWEGAAYPNGLPQLPQLVC